METLTGKHTHFLTASIGEQSWEFFSMVAGMQFKQLIMPLSDSLRSHPFIWKIHMGSTSESMKSSRKSPGGIALKSIQGQESYLPIAWYRKVSLEWF